MSDKTFVNPYNFVPLYTKAEDRHKEREGTKEKGRLKGKIRYTITTRTPLFIPNTSNDRYFGVRAREEDPDNYHKSYDFFSYHDLAGREEKPEQLFYEPVIPGSEMRGAVRSLYEILTDSCISSYNDQTFSRRTPDRYKSGLLVRDEKGNWKLFEAYDHICRNNSDFEIKQYKELDQYKDGSMVRFRFSERNNNRGKYAKQLIDICPHGEKTGFLIKGIDGPVLPKNERASKCDSCPGATKMKCQKNGEKECYLLMKHNVHVFSQYKDGSAKKEVTEIKGMLELSQMDAILDLYKENVSGAYAEYRETWNTIKKSEKNGTLPVYYCELKDEISNKIKICLSPACITREIYENSLKTVLGNHYKTCTHKEKACPACSLFGMLNTESKETLPSRIRFSDLHIKANKNSEEEKPEQYYDELRTLDELGMPKPSSMEFYLKKPEVQLKDSEELLIWTWDYYITVDQNTGKTRLCMYDPDIAGRKIYWHSMDAYKNQLTYKEALRKEKEWEKEHDKDRFITKRNKTIRPVKTGVTFEGELYFDEITPEELKRLTAILDMTKTDEYGLKIGAAKPLGLGSVELHVQEIKERQIVIENDTIMYKETEPLSKDESPSLNQNQLFAKQTKDVLKVLRFNAVDEEKYRVHYPYINWDACQKGDEEGFKWFGENRKALRYGKKPGKRPGQMVDDPSKVDLRSNNSGPTDRKQIPFRSYLIPVTPELEKNSCLKASFDFSSKRNDKNRPDRSAAGKSRTVTTADTYFGTVKFFNREKAFGKIRYEKDREIFFHISQVKNADNADLKEGTGIRFQIGQGKKGPQAIECYVV